MPDREKPAVATPTAPAPAVGTATIPIVPPRRSPGHRGADVKDTVAEMAAKAHEISLEAGSKMAAAMKDVVGAAAGLTGLVLERARPPPVHGPPRTDDPGRGRQADARGRGFAREEKAFHSAGIFRNQDDTEGRGASRLSAQRHHTPAAHQARAEARGQATQPSPRRSTLPPKAGREKADDEARGQEAPSQVGGEVEVQSFRQDREKKVGRGHPAWRCGRARPRSDTNRLEKSHPRSGLAGRG